jgi:glycine betaine/proline transport system substrate-binding protein
MKHITKLIALVLILFVSSTALFAQGQQAAGDAGEPKVANLVYVNWEEGVAYTHLAKAVLEDMMDYEVNITAAEAGIGYTSIAQGDQDAFMETWLPVLHKDYVERYKEDIVDLGYVFEGTRSGLVVPTYVTIDKISELNAHVDKFDGQITGIDAGAGVMQTTENQVIPMYDLDLELLASSGPAMVAALKDAYQNEEWIVVTGWTPHSMFGMFDLKFLEQDADKQVWGKGNIHIFGRKNIEQDKPTLAQFLKNMYLESGELADLMVYIAESDDDEMTAAREWMNQNEDVVADWVPQS